MALINCPECGRQVSDSAPQCPGCGYIISKQNNNQLFNKAIDYITKRPIVFLVCIVAIICLLVFVKIGESNTNKESTYNYHNSYSSDNSANASTIFNNLKMSNFSASLGAHGGKMSCEVLNNNSFTVHGYFYVGFYDKSGNLMYSQLMSLPSVSSGEKVICSTLIPKDDYPTGYSYVKYSQASLTKD